MRASAGPRTLVDVIRPDATAGYRDLLLVVAFGTLMGALAQISLPLPFTPVPITGQTFGVLLVGALLGSRRGGLALAVHLVEGLAGLPVFAEGHSAWSLTRLGVPTFIGPTAGYLISFPIAAYAVGVLAERGWDRRLWTAGIAMIFGNGIIYLFGAAWLATLVGPAQAVALGVVPFLPGDVLKIVAAAVLLPGGWRLLAATGAIPTQR
ncbi:MAG: biotin transporter BioY [Chloroflexi bacterium]|nr:biotin transporter BioY [Chloroflexota bacterium]